MLDQSFSSSNFNTVFLKENRKGNFNKLHLTKEYIDKHAEFKAILQEKKDLGGGITKEQLDSYALLLDKINKEKEEIRLNTFQTFSEKILKPNFKFEIDYNPHKKVFTSDKDAASFYAIKQLQYNLNKIYKVVQSDRNKIIKQLYYILSDGFPKIVIKTDIKAFYESIPQDKLFTKMESNTLLSPLSKKLIKKLFYEFESKKDKGTIAEKRGVPRGIGLSAYLSELYMRDIDNEIKSIEDLAFYSRYVDDIIMVFIPKTSSTCGEYLESVKKIICEKNGLELKDGSDGEESKTHPYNFLTDTYTHEISYLGYCFNITNNKSVIEISKNKLQKYRERLDATISAYNLDSKFNEKEARKMLFSRLKFLTGNFHLNNIKRNVKSGIYYSNAMLSLNNSSFESLDTLDKELSKAFRNISPPVKIGIDKTKMLMHLRAKFSFKKGFENKEKNFYSFNFSLSESKYYFKKFGRPVNKFEVIKSIWS